MVKRGDSNQASMESKYEYWRFELSSVGNDGGCGKLHIELRASLSKI